MADNEEELVDVNANVEDSEPVESADSDESLNSEGEVNAPAKKNTSNFSKLSKKAKRLEKTLNDPEALRQRIAELEWASNSNDDSDDDSDSDSDDTDTDESKPVSTRYAPVEIELKILKTPGASEYEKEIMATFKRYPDMKFEDAFALAKASNPVSETKRNLSFKSSSKPKELASLPQEEALKLEPAEYLKWARATGNVKE